MLKLLSSIFLISLFFIGCANKNPKNIMIFKQNNIIETKDAKEKFSATIGKTIDELDDFKFKMNQTKRIEVVKTKPIYNAYDSYIYEQIKGTK